jgi:hypothetical protein
MKKMKNTMKKVAAILVAHPQTKDDDKLLLPIYWMDEMKEHNLDPLKMTGWNVLKEISNGILTNADYVCRCRRRLQQLHPEYRGAKYNARLANQQSVQKDLGYDNGN